MPEGVAATSDATPATFQLLDIFIALDEARKSEFRSALGALETLVFEQIVNPNDAAQLYMIADQAWDEATDDVKSGPVRLEYQHTHMARGLGMELGLFGRAAASIRHKLILYLETGQAVEYLDRSILRQLEELFGLRPIPLSVDLTVVRRLLTVAARAQPEKLTAEVVGMLNAVGAEVPSPTPKLPRRARAARGKSPDSGPGSRTGKRRRAKSVPIPSHHPARVRRRGASPLDALLELLEQDPVRAGAGNSE